jgi:hypothetical protein
MHTTRKGRRREGGNVERKKRIFLLFTNVESSQSCDLEQSKFY